MLNTFVSYSPGVLLALFLGSLSPREVLAQFLVVPVLFPWMLITVAVEVAYAGDAASLPGVIGIVLGAALPVCATVYCCRRIRRAPSVPVILFLTSLLQAMLMLWLGLSLMRVG